MVFDQQLQIVGFFLRKSFFQNNTVARERRRGDRPPTKK
jgi:hypothetical protein